MPKISALPAVTTVVAADILPMVTVAGPTTNQITMDNFRISFFGDSGGALTATPLTKISTLRTTQGVGVGVAASTSRAINSTGTTVLTAGTSQYAAYLAPTMTSAASTAGYGVYVQATLAAAAFTQTNTYGLYIDNASIGAGAAITNQYGVYIAALSGAATTNIGLYNAGTTQLQGNIGVGTAPVAQQGIRVVTTLATDTAQVGILSSPTGSSAATGSIRGVHSKASSAAAVFTASLGQAFYADSPTVGAGSAITSSSGLYVANQGAAGITNAYGIYVATQSSAATINLGIYVQGGGVQVAAGNLGIGVAPAGQYGLLMTGTSVVSSGNVSYGAYLNPTHDSNATTSGAAVFAKITTAAAAFTMVSGYGVYVDTPGLGAGSAITSQFGVRILNQGATGVTNAYGINVTAQSGASSINTSIYVGVGTTGISVSGTTTSAATTKYGVLVDWTADSGTTAAAHGLYSGITTAAAAFTLTNLYGLYIAATAKGAGSTITNRYGAYINAPTDGGTLNVGLLVTGAAAATAAIAVSGGNLVIGGTVPGASSANTLCFTGTSVTPSGTVDMVHLYGLDISAGHRSLALYCEEVTNAAVAVASTHRLPVTINGVQYAILLTTVLA